ncbi:hypothetical protein GPECTOR_5g442 [Gonium pectorale]|uniref:TRP C-terminal domain-containing protein n=1 Tax=Gonium pectorale TaxID=33097 RepID=A0A150GXE7_GONPE|nr:hypothetical protein GPECTOR_5g442 [Gonium pectorale]|eukprot:KXZ54362.1 hypothetical protein GPECTOR_5g442 [Gonium pectorale]
MPTTPIAQALPVWTQEPLARALQARCVGHPPAGASLPPAADSNVTSSELRHACHAQNSLEACAAEPSSGAGGVEPLAAGAVLEVAPTYMRLEGFAGSLRPGAPITIRARLYNGLGQPVHHDTLAFTVRIALEPRNRLANASLAPTASSSNSSDNGSSSGSSDGSHLLAAPQRPWQDARLAQLDPNAASGGSLEVHVVNGVATWPYFTVRGWPGMYDLVLTAAAKEDPTLYQVAALRQEITLLHCPAGTALDLSEAQQPGAQPSWLGCSRCGRGRVALWRDERPTVWELDTANYTLRMKDMAERAAAGDASCMPCPAHATCLGEALMVPEGGHWHSAHDSTVFHKCPNEDAPRPWAGLPAAAPADLRVAIVHVQYYIMITRLPIAYPDVISNMRATLSALTGAESTVAFSYGCLFPGLRSDGQARAQLLGALAAPIAVVVASVALWGLRRSFRARCADAATQWAALVAHLNRLDSSVGAAAQLRIFFRLALFILYPSWAQSALSVFACYMVDRGDGSKAPCSWLPGGTATGCGICSSSASPALTGPIGVAAVLLGSLLPPLSFFLLLRRHRSELNDPSVQDRYGFLYLRYRAKYYWWESVLMLEELTLVAVEVFGRTLRCPLIYVLEFQSLCVLSLTLTLSLFFVVSDDIGADAASAVALIILVINIALLVGLLWRSVRALHAIIDAVADHPLSVLRFRMNNSWPRSFGDAAKAVSSLGCYGEPKVAQNEKAVGKWIDDEGGKPEDGSAANKTPESPAKKPVKKALVLVRALTLRTLSRVGVDVVLTEDDKSPRVDFSV